HEDLALVSIGNTRTRIAGVVDGELEPSQVLTNDDADAVARAIVAATGGTEPAGGATAIIASVNMPACEKIEKALADAGVRVLRFGRDLAIPVVHTLAEPEG